MSKANSFLMTIALTAVPMTLSGCGSERQDLGGNATLKIYCPQLSSRYNFLYLDVKVNGQALGKVEKADADQAKEFTFYNANNGKNTLVLRLVYKRDDKEEDTKKNQFTAMPGSVTRADVTISGIIWRDIEKVTISTFGGADPVQVAEAKARKEAAEAEEATRKAKTEAGLEAEFKKFAKEFVPDLQQAIDKYQEHIKQFTAQRAVFAEEMAKLGVDPEQRLAYVRKKEIIDKMKEDVIRMVTERKETYIKWKELSLLRETAEAKEQRDRLLQNAKRSAEFAEETFRKYMSQAEETGVK